MNSLPQKQENTRQVKARTAHSSLFTFYDIESLSNVFSMVTYTPNTAANTGLINIYYLLDNNNISSVIDSKILENTIVTDNPGLPPVNMILHNLETVEANMHLMQTIGVSNSSNVCDQQEQSSYPAYLRPVCDTDENYDPTTHPFLAGYNSTNYDTTMLALYCAEIFAELFDYETRLADAQQKYHATRTSKDREAAANLVQTIHNKKPRFQSLSASIMRAHNDKLFDAQNIDYMPGYLDWNGQASKIRRAMLQSGRHLDVARLNELQWKVSLKRLLGMLGYQIKESEKLGHDSTITTIEEFYELISYNVADCLGLAQLFKHPTYSSAFDLKAALLTQYSETIFNKNNAIRYDRLRIDSSSAQFVGRILAPYKPLPDIETVSYEYPDPQDPNKTVNVLEECVQFFEKEVVPNRTTNSDQAQAYSDFMKIVNYYRSIEGQNFNDSEEYSKQYDRKAISLQDIPKAPNNLPYFTKDGKPTSCFVTFSTGGIHGAEIDQSTFDQQIREFTRQKTMLEYSRILFPDARDLVAEIKRQHAILTLPDGSTVDKRLVLFGSTPETIKFRKPKTENPEQVKQLELARLLIDDPVDLLATQRPQHEEYDLLLPNGQWVNGKNILAETTLSKATYRQKPSTQNPQLFVTKNDGSTKLHPKYARTSAQYVTHEDFTSYYPNLLRKMRAFYNPELGEDRYANIFFDKEAYGQQIKELKAELAMINRKMPRAQTTDQQHEYSVKVTQLKNNIERLTTLRNGTKLILNAASGAGDASHKTPIRMNNRIISMRIIGQLFSWRIGQAQTLAGAKIISTNTDGLYSVLDPKINNQVLAEQASLIGIDIEPEPMFLISKDSNNRMELTVNQRSLDTSDIISASGSTLACYAGPRPDKSLAHPAIIDHALAKYLQTIASRGEHALAEPFDTILGQSIIEQAINTNNPIQTLLLFQNVLAASRGSITYPFAADPLIARDEDHLNIKNPRALQMVNRVFIVLPGTEQAVSLHSAGAWKIPPSTQAKRKQTNTTPQRDPIATKILSYQGWASTHWEKKQNPQLTLIPHDRDVSVRKINGVDPYWSMLVCNDDLHTLSYKDQEKIINALDIKTYTVMLGQTFTKNWMNATQNTTNHHNQEKDVTHE